MTKQLRWPAALALAMGLFIATGAHVPLQAQQPGTGSVQGTITNASNNQPMAAVNVQVVGTQRGSVTERDGTYTIRDVPPGDYSVRIQFIGFTTITRNVTVTAGQPTVVNAEMSYTALDMGEIIVTGVAGEVSRAQLPFVVDQIRGDDLPVTRMNVASALQGKVAGAQVVHASGMPGTAPSILLRGATQIVGRNQDPVYIVDGVMLTSSVIDIDALDIETIEVVKGAAAASLYGSRAAAGVIQITTNRGRNFADGQVRYSARSQFGTSDLPGAFPVLKHHFWRMTDDGRSFVTNAGQPCTFRGTPSWDPNNQCPGNMPFAGQRAAPGQAGNVWNSYATGAWPDGTFDHVNDFFDGGGQQQHYVSAAGRQGATNFLVSFNRLEDDGVMLGRQGFARNSFRVNLDQMINENVRISATAYYSRSGRDTGIGANTLFGLTRMQAGVDLTTCEAVPAPGGGLQRQPGSCLDRPEDLLFNVNPTNTESPNPLYSLLVQETMEFRGRFLGSTSLQYQPASWVEVEADVSYDRLDTDSHSLNPKGWRTISPSNANLGAISFGNGRSEGLNASATALFRWRPTDQISSRTRLRYLYESARSNSNSVSGSQFGVTGVHTIQNTLSDTRSGSSGKSTTIAEGFFLITDFDYGGRYFVDVLLRNDGSSRFGENERRHTYYRVGGSWQLQHEPWFNIGFFDDFKIRASRGSAGGVPNFSHQYETFGVSGGVPTPSSLGNQDLQPEVSVENEFGVDFSFMNRFAATVTYAATTTEDQIMSVPLPAFNGYTSQIRNVGTLATNTWELSLDALLVRTQDFMWTSRLLFDRTRSEITHLNRPEFRTGVSRQGLENIFRIREGEAIGTFYGNMAAKSCDHLMSGMNCGDFAVNDEGFLVWVGSGGSLSNQQWGQWSGMVSPIGVPIMWGAPFTGQCTDRVTGERTNSCEIGTAMPDYSIGFSNSIGWRGVRLYGLLDIQRGTTVYNQPLQWALFRSNVGFMDQTGVPEAEQKPIGYFQSFYGGLGGLTPSDFFMEDGSFVKLRELSLEYRFNADQLSRIPGLSGMNGLGINIAGNNLWTGGSDYRGYDPDVGYGGGSVGSAAIARVDGYNYPSFRTWTLGLELTF